MTFAGVIKLRPAAQEDAELVHAITRACMKGYVVQTWGSWDEEFQHKLFSERWNPTPCAIVRLDKRDIGCITLEEHQNHHHLGRLYILPEHQGHGIGTHLLRNMIRKADSASVPMRLSVLRVNPARRLYEREGFHVTEETKERYFMERPIQPE